MRRADLEHVVAAAAQTVGEDEFVVVGSQAILGSYPDAPASLGVIDPLLRDWRRRR